MGYTFLDTFFKPSFDLTKRILTATVEEAVQNEPSLFTLAPENAWHTDAFQRIDDLPDSTLQSACDDIALRLWGYLAGRARLAVIAPRRAGQEAFTFTQDDVAPRLQRHLGLSADHAELVRALLEGVWLWLEDKPGHSFTAAWGDMSLDSAQLRFAQCLEPVDGRQRVETM